MDNTKNFIIYSLVDGMSKDRYQINASTKKVKRIPLPFGSNSHNVLNHKDNDNVICYNSGWLTPTTTYDYNAQNGKIEKSKWFSSKAIYPDIDKYTVKEIEVPSYDGTKVPLSIMYPKDIIFNGSTPCFLTGYGAYGISEYPYFVPEFFAFLKQHIVIAISHVRGGGEKGEAWHLGGYKKTKPNTWKDFIACGEYLIKEKYTSSQKLIGEGMSAGGILIGNAIAERPDLFAVAIDQVGCTNMLRLETTPNGPNQIPEFGGLNNADELQGLIEMDAQHKIKAGVKYPAVIVRTGYNDPRVIPWMPGKFAAVLQNSSSSNKPVLFNVNYQNGHFTEDKSVMNKDMANIYSFALWQTGHPNFTLKN